MREPVPTSFRELSARERARVLLDAEGQREMLGPFDRFYSSWLEQQGIVSQSDDGAVILQGRLQGSESVVMALEGRFQGGSIGEVSGSKLRWALHLCRRDAESGRKRIPVLLLETGGVRLQEANLGLELISEIQAELLALRRLVPVIAVIAGPVGCFGGMSIAAALCSYVLMTRQGRYSLNGPEVIEQEAGRAEMNAADRKAVWQLIGGEQRFACGFADALVPDDVAAMRSAIYDFSMRGVVAVHRSEQVDRYLEMFERKKAAGVETGAEVRHLLSGAGPK